MSVVSSYPGAGGSASAYPHAATLPSRWLGQ